MKPYQFTMLQKAVERLVSGYTAQLDPVVLDVLKGDAVELGKQVLPSERDETVHFLFELSNRRLTPGEAQAALQTVKPFVKGFPKLSREELTHLFQKQHHLVEPNWQALDLREQTYLGWNDIATQRKFLVTRHTGELMGVSGTLSPKIHRGVCAICQTLSEVSLFAATTVKNQAGNYQTNGNFICRDSRNCNRQLTSEEPLRAFITTVSPQ